MLEESRTGGDSQWKLDGGYAYYASATINHMGTTPIPTTVCEFDPYEELLWTGYDSGRVVSYFGPQMQRYTAFVSSQTTGVRALEIADECVLSLSANCLRAHTRHAVPIFEYSTDRMVNLSSLLRIPDAPNTVFLSGQQQEIIHLDFETQRELRVVPIRQKDASILRTNGKFILSADSEGQIAVRDPNSLVAVNVIGAHGGPIIDIDVMGSQVITCGCSYRSGSIHGDPYVKMYDLRTLRSLPPLPLSFAPIFSRFLPSYSQNKILIVSQLTERSVISPFVVESNGFPLCSLSISPSTNTLAFGDTSGAVHLYSDRENPVYNENAWKTDFADPAVGPPNSFSIEDWTNCLASIPFPFSADDYLLSDWPREMCAYEYRKRLPPVDHPSVRAVHFVGYASNPRAGTPLARFNIVPYALDNKSQEEEETAYEPEGVCPRFYRKVVVKGGRSPLEDISAILQRYNNSKHVPIEYNHGASSANPLVQMLWSLPSLRNVFLSHICEEEHCLCCELSFLFRMLTDKSPRHPASSNNLMRALRGTAFPGLTTPTMGKVQQLIHFLFNYAKQHLTAEEGDRLREILEYSLTVNSRCVRCAHVQSEARSSFVFKLTYPTNVGSMMSFCTLLEKSLNSRTSSENHCDECGTTTRIEDTMRVRSLPPLMLIDANPSSPNYTPFWTDQLQRNSRRPKYAKLSCLIEQERSERACRWGDECRNRPYCKYSHGSSDWQSECSLWMEEGRGKWANVLPPRIHVRLSGGICAVQANPPGDAHDTTTYNLVAIINVISENPLSPTWSHVVTELKTKEEGDEDELEWIIVNGVAITKVCEEEALFLDHRWKLPLVFAYVRENSSIMTVEETRVPIPADVFLNDNNLTGNDDVGRERRLLTIPGKGDIVGIDAEFINIQKDCGKKSVGRVSCVDSTGAVVLMDDYVVACDGDVVADYLTQYSGIVEHDLCPKRSTKHLTTLKRVYMKLLHLIERGVVFVGHALVNDFSVLNIYVPEAQMRDTVELFRLPQQRLISLQYLAWHLLGERIQENTHDSVEDARVSLMLYRKWEQLRDDGTLDATIRGLYETGKISNWRLGISPCTESPLNTSTSS